MDSKKLAHLFQRLRSGQATPAEKDLLEKFWNQALHDTSFTDTLSESEKQALKTQTFEAIRNRLPDYNRTKIVPLYARPWLYKVAASISVLVVLSALWYWNTSRLLEVHTGYGETLTIILPDQSSVVLNGNSKLRYDDDWSETDPREVWIEGEGFFAVQHTRSHQKFIVHASNHLNVEVLGTKFNVKTRQSQAEVMLQEGKVKLDLPDNSAADASIFLKPGELATLDNNRRITTRVVGKNNYALWTKNKLLFDKTPLREVAEMLEQTYGIHVQFQDEEMKSKELSGEISSATADDILKAIVETFDLQVVRDGDTVKLNSTP
jgi:transmembrane sensor